MERLVDIDPQKEFEFELINAGSAKATLHIKNLVDDNLAFKVKTTAPKFYVVKPNTGIIKGNQDVKVAINLQPIPSSVKDHKFMLQVARTTLTTDDLNPETLAAFWNNIKSMDKAAKEDYKFRVALKSADIASKESRSSAHFGGEKEEPEKVGSTPEVKQEIKNIIEEVKEEVSPNKEHNDKMAKLEKKIEELKRDIEEKDRELKELKDKETKEDNKAFGNQRGQNRNPSDSSAAAKVAGGNQSQMMYLAIAMIGELILGYLIGKFVF